MDEFPNNSSRAQNEEPLDDRNIEKIISGEATVRKPSKFKRFRQSFIAGDASSVGEYVLWNLLIPSAQDALSYVATTFIEMMIHGDRRTRFGPTSTPAQGLGSTSRINYGGISSHGQNRLVLGPSQNSPISEPMHTRFNPNEIVVPTRPEAEDIINKMIEVLEKYNAVTVSDLYRMVGVSPDYTDQKWGWTNLDAADVKRVSDGVLLVLPRPQDLN